MKVKKAEKLKVKSVIKWVVIILLTLFAYAFSLYQNGFEKTNLKLLQLIICSAFGFLIFFVFYYIFCGINLIIYNKKLKRRTSSIVNCDEQIEKAVNEPKYQFSYDTKSTFKQNLSSALTVMTTLAGDVANSYGKKGKYALLDFTVYDALSFVGNCIDGVESRVDGMFKFIEFTGVKDKPLPFIENALTKLIDKELSANNDCAETVENNPPKKDGLSKKIVNKVKNLGGKVAVFTFKGVIENTLNDVIRFVGAEAFRVFSKDAKSYEISNELSLEQDFKEV